MRVHTIFVLVLLSVLASGCANLPVPEAANGGSNKADQAGDADKSDGQVADVNKSESLVRLADDIEAHGGNDTALKLYQQAVAVSGNAPDANVRLGDAYMRADQIKPAIEAYRAALIKEPSDDNALLGLGAALVRRGLLDEGLADLAKAAPSLNTGMAYNRLGVAQIMAGHFADAQDSFEKGRAVAPDDLDIATNLALAAALAGDADKAATLAHEIAQSPAAEERHRRDLVVVLGLIGRSGDEMRAVAPELSQHEFAALLKHAEAIRGMKDPKTRAKALGMMRR